MNIEDAKEIIKPHLNKKLANEWGSETDSLLWIEQVFFDPNNIPFNINSLAGEALAEWVELELEKLKEVSSQ